MGDTCDMGGVTPGDFAKVGAPNSVEVLALLHAVAVMTDDQKAALQAALAGRDEVGVAGADAASNAGWRSTVAIGGQRQVAWYLARHAAEHVATERGFPHDIAHKIGYITAAVAHRDRLTDDQFQALTQPWQVAVGPL